MKNPNGLNGIAFGALVTLGVFVASSYTAQQPSAVAQGGGIQRGILPIPGNTVVLRAFSEGALLGPGTVDGLPGQSGNLFEQHSSIATQPYAVTVQNLGDTSIAITGGPVNITLLPGESRGFHYDQGTGTAVWQAGATGTVARFAWVVR